MQPQLVLVIVAYHPSAEEVAILQKSLACLSPEIGYGVVVNDYRPGEPIERLAPGARMFLSQRANLGYGRAFNLGLAALMQRGELPAWLGVLNTDLSWQSGSMEKLLAWLQQHDDVVLAVPQIHDPHGRVEQLCKVDPTVLAQLSRRFIPERFKPAWLKRYDQAYVMAERNLDQVIDVPYLSGCCMLMRTEAVQRVGGFDSSFFLYLEDADLTRSMRALGRCVHLPVAKVVHRWGRASHKSLRLTAVSMHSSWLYFNKWGWRLW